MNCEGNSIIKQQLSKLKKMINDFTGRQYGISLKHFTNSFILTEILSGVNFTFMMLLSKYKLN